MKNLNHTIRNVIFERSKMINSPDHGLRHWDSVESRGLQLGMVYGLNAAERKVISYFAHLHDAMRINESTDLPHGARAAAFAAEYREDIDLDDRGFEALSFACVGHSFQWKPPSITVAICWDADRLDLIRLGIHPDPKLLNTESAKNWAVRIVEEVSV
jgi:uncharacterized protein